MGVHESREQIDNSGSSQGEKANDFVRKRIHQEVKKSKAGLTDTTGVEREKK